MCTPGSMNSLFLFGDFFRDFWPGFLALEKTVGGVVGGGGGEEGRGEGGEKSKNNTVLQY